MEKTNAPEHQEKGEVSTQSMFESQVEQNVGYPVIDGIYILINANY